jgi:CheY-like chemotaxis protein
VLETVFEQSILLSTFIGAVTKMVWNLVESKIKSDITTNENGKKLHPAILLVEDDDVVRAGLKEILTTYGFCVDTASNGKDALLALKNKPHPVAIILDLMMPIMGGKEFRVHQKEDPSIMDIPVIIVTGSSDENLSDPTVKKPISIELLLSTIKEIVEK